MTGFVDYAVWWGPYLVGLLAIIYAFLTGRGSREESADGGLRPWPFLGMLAGVLVVAFLLVALLARPEDQALRYAAVLLVGGLCSLAAYAFAARYAGPQSQAFFALGVALLETSFLRNYFRDEPMVYLYVNALGAWLVAAVATYGAGTALANAARAASLAVAVAAAAVAMAVHHYSGSGITSLFAMDLFAIVLLLSMLGSLAANALAARRMVLLPVVAAVLVVLIWWFGRLLSSGVIDDPLAGLCGFVGAVAVVLSSWAASASAERDGAKPLIGTAEARLLCVLVAVAAVAICMRWLAGYGIALGAVCALAILPFAHSLRLGENREQPSGSAEVGVVSALASVALVRALIEATTGTSSRVDMFESYAVPALALGGCLTLMMSSIAGGWRERGGGTPHAALLRGLVTVVMAGAAIFAISYLWRGDAVNGLALGIASGVFYALIVSATAEGIELTPGLQVLVVALVPPFLMATTNLTREQRIHVLVWTLGVAALVVILASAWRLIARARAENT